MTKEIHELHVFLTDDGCTDGTADAIRETFPDRDIHILQGTGNLYWAGGMRFAWNAALNQSSNWDYYLLLNDDTTINPHCFNELFDAQKFCIKQFGKKGLISGITCSTKDPMKITYGGDIITNKITGRTIRVGRNSTPQLVDLTNANILLVPQSVVDTIGIFYAGYTHSRADYDYSMQARKNGFPVLITSAACGECDNDHVFSKEKRDAIEKMTIAERKAYYNHPIRSYRDYLMYIRRNMPLRYPFAILFHYMEIYTPGIYNRINEMRGVYKK